MKILHFVRVIRKIRKNFLQLIPGLKFAEQKIVTERIRKMNKIFGKFLLS